MSSKRSAPAWQIFPDARAVLVNSDGGSTDGTQQVVSQGVVDLKTLFIGDQQSSLHKNHYALSRYPRKSSAFRTILRLPSFESQSLCRVDSDLREHPPEWIELW